MMTPPVTLPMTLIVPDPVPQSENPVLPPPTRRSVWTLREKIIRLIWGTAGRLVWNILPAARPGVLRLFGGTAGRGCHLARTVEIAIPWHVTLGDNVEIGERVILYGLGPITIGDRCVLDYRAHLCAGTHDLRDSRFPLIKPPITLGDDCFVGIDAYIGPEVELGSGTRVRARASVYRSCAGSVELVGNPAKEVDFEGGESGESGGSRESGGAAP